MKQIALNTRIPVGLKRALDHYCETKGLKVQSYIENLIQEHMEDVLDEEAIEKRSDEPTIPFEAVLKEFAKRSKRKP